MRGRGRPACLDCYEAQKRGHRWCFGHNQKNKVKTAKNRYRNGFPTVQMMKEDLLADTVLPEPTPADFGMSVEEFKIEQEIVRSMGGELVVIRVREESQAGRALAVGQPVKLSTEVNEIGRVRLRAKS
jgi:hypothetical protein